jgi:non-specific serine/threonine protein kinase
MRKVYKLGPLLLESGVLTQDGAALAVGGRGVALLTALVSHAPEFVTKSALMDAAWPGLVVEEANLAVQISTLRRALGRIPGGEDWIETLARRGYRFVGPVAEVAVRADAESKIDRGRTNLPAALTSFVGREHELAQIKQRLPATRLLTLTGMGGIGKTRLAQQAAADALDAYCDGVWFVDLAPLSDPTLVPSAVAQVLGMKPSAAEPLLTALCTQLKSREMLLVLDNCEQVLDGCARLVEALVRETAKVTIVATSRESLHLAAEDTYAVPPLPLPGPRSGAQGIARSEAVQLFVERARQYRPHFDLADQRAHAVADICARLDGIPLALELAAARLSMLPVEEIAHLLDQRFRLLKSGNRELPRHQTLRAMIDWSYELLDDAEKALFCRLSVFAGGWTLAAAEAVCVADAVAAGEVVYVLIGLIEQSLVVANESGDRYRMLETVRQYARDRLQMSSGENEWRNRHLACFLALAEEAAPNIDGSQQRPWLERLETEHDNLRSALTWATGADAVSGLRLAGACWRFWLIRGYAREGLHWLSAMLAAAPVQERTEHRARALGAAATLARVTSDFSKARTLYEAALSIWRELDNRRGVAGALGNLGMVALDQNDYPRAMALHEESLVIFRELGNRQGVARALLAMGNAVRTQGDEERAQALYEQSLAIEREMGDQRGTAIALNNLGQVASDFRKDYSTARSLQDQAMVIHRELGNRWGIAWTLGELARVSYSEGDYPSSRELLLESFAIWRDLADRSGVASSLEGLGILAFALGRAEAGARLCGQAARLRDELGSPQLATGLRDYERQIASARASFGNDAAFDRAWQEGHAMTMERAIEYALQDHGADADA